MAFIGGCGAANDGEPEDADFGVDDEEPPDSKGVTLGPFGLGVVLGTLQGVQFYFVEWRMMAGLTTCHMRLILIRALGLIRLWLLYGLIIRTRARIFQDQSPCSHGSLLVAIVVGVSPSDL